MSKFELLTKEELEIIVKNNIRWGDIFKTQSYGNYKSSMKLKLKNLLDKYEIDYSHLPSGKGWSKGLTKKTSSLINSSSKKIPLELILVKNRNYGSSRLKKRLIKEKGWKDECKICGLNNIWNNKSIVLHLDHINGVHDDNRIENLRILCPNCHSQTSTYCKGWKN